MRFSEHLNDEGQNPTEPRYCFLDLIIRYGEILKDFRVNETIPDFYSRFQIRPSNMAEIDLVSWTIALDGLHDEPNSGG